MVRMWNELPPLLPLPLLPPLIPLLHLITLELLASYAAVVVSGVVDISYLRFFFAFEFNCRPNM
ncbi:unnamed protein product [Cunninghamella echinulata]